MFRESLALAAHRAFSVSQGHALCRETLKWFLFCGPVPESTASVLASLVTGGLLTEPTTRLSPGSAASSRGTILGQVGNLSGPGSPICKLEVQGQGLRRGL